MPPIPSTSGVHVEFWIRDAAPSQGARERITRRLDRLTARDRLDGYDVRTWGKSVRLSNREVDEDDVAERVEAFRRFARRHDGTDAFERSHRTATGRTGDTHAERQLPVLALAAYDADGLAAVVTSDDRTGAIRSFLDDLADDTGPSPETATP